MAILSEQLISARREVQHIKANVEQLVGASSSGDVRGTAFLRLAEILAGATDALSSVSAMPGIAQYAKEQMADPDYDVGARFTGVVNETAALVNWITANYPKEASGYLQTHQFEASGRTTERRFAAEQTAGFRTQAAALIAACDAFL